MAKLPRDIQLATKEGLLQTIPKYSRFLRFSAITPASEGGEEQCQGSRKRKADGCKHTGEEKLEVPFGPPWTHSTFIQQACKVGHPLLGDAGLPSDLQGAIDKH